MEIEKQNCLIFVVFLSNNQALWVPETSVKNALTSCLLSHLKYYVLVLDHHWRDQGKKNNYDNHAGKTKKIYLIYEILVFLEWARVESSSRQINSKAIISSKGQNFL